MGSAYCARELGAELRRLDEGRSAAPGGAVGFGIPALNAGRGKEISGRGGRRLAADCGGDRGRGVSGRAQGAVVTLPPGRMLVARDQEERAQQIEHERPAEPRIGSSQMEEGRLHGLHHRSYTQVTPIFSTWVASVNPVVGT